MFVDCITPNQKGENLVSTKLGHDLTSYERVNERVMVYSLETEGKSRSLHSRNE